LLLLVASLPAVAADARIDSERQAFAVATVVEGLQNPWGLAFLPDGRILVTERSGRLRIVADGRLLPEPVRGLPEIREQGQGGLLGVALHPRFADNSFVYLAFAAPGDGGFSTEVVRGRLAGEALVDVQPIFAAQPKTGGGRHFGGRLAFAPDGTLFITLGDRGEQDRAQDLADHHGSLIRVNDDGTVPADNPFVDRERVRPELYTWGNRNMQGIAVHPETGAVWTHEHGPQGGDEINVMRPGINYGWPVITYGVEYGIGTTIGEGVRKPGMAQPLYKWVPSIAPSGMAFYTGSAYPAWTGNLFVGSLKFGLLVRLEVDGETITREERLLGGKFGRIRDVVQGPDGLLYLLTDEPRGRLLKLVPG
jgi:glucose/arabinose dehydrogenase